MDGEIEKEGGRGDCTCIGEREREGEGGGQLDATRRGLQINRSEQIMNDIFVAPA